MGEFCTLPFATFPGPFIQQTRGCSMVQLGTLDKLLDQACPLVPTCADVCRRVTGLTGFDPIGGAAAERPGLRAALGAGAGLPGGLPGPLRQLRGAHPKGAARI